MNLVIPGGGSLLAGRRIGYLQLALCGMGFALTMIFGVKFILWGLQHWAELRDPTGDPAETLLTLWRGCRMPLAGIGLFGVAWIWAFLTNMGILRASRAPASPGAKPPVIR